MPLATVTRTCQMKYPVPLFPDGTLATHGIHDATVQAFSFVSEDRFDLCLRAEDGTDRWFFLIDVPRIGFADLINGTIVCDFFCWGLASSPIPHPAADAAWRVLLAGTFTDTELTSAIGRLTVRYPGHSLVFITSSYGGTIAALCRDVLMDDASQSDPPPLSVQCP
jgi:hypothetical protein